MERSQSEEGETKVREGHLVATIMRIVVTKQHTAAKLAGKYLNAIRGISFGRIRLS